MPYELLVIYRHERPFSPSTERGTMQTDQQVRPVGFDPVALVRSFKGLTKIVGGQDPWKITTYWQGQFIAWYLTSGSSLPQLDGLASMASNSASELNAFLVSHGYDPLFREFTQGGVGSATVNDLLIQWNEQAMLTELPAVPPGSHTLEVFPAFEVTQQNFELFDLPNDSYAVKLSADGGFAVWLLQVDDPPERQYDLLDRANDTMADKVPVDPDRAPYNRVVVPCMDLNLQSDLVWMHGMNKNDHVIDQAVQVLRIRMNELGARTQSATALGTTRSSPSARRRLMFNKPFYGWFTGPDSSVPFSVFYSTPEAWRRVEL